MGRHFIYYGDTEECSSLNGEAIKFANIVEQKARVIGLDYYQEEYFFSNEKHIRIQVNPYSTFLHVYASGKYKFKAGLIRGGDVVVDENGDYVVEDFLPSSIMEPDPAKRVYRKEKGFQFAKSENTYKVIYPIPSRSTGLMHSAIELALGASRIVDVKQDFDVTHGIYREDNDNDWLVEIGKNRCIARKIKKIPANKFESKYVNVIKNSPLGYVPEDLYIPTGEKYQKELDEGRIIVLSGENDVKSLYIKGESLDKSNTIGFSFNDKGDKAVNVFAEITITRNPNNSMFSSILDYTKDAVINGEQINISITTLDGVSEGSVSKTTLDTANFRQYSGKEEFINRYSNMYNINYGVDNIGSGLDGTAEYLYKQKDKNFSNKCYNTYKKTNGLQPVLSGRGIANQVISDPVTFDQNFYEHIIWIGFVNNVLEKVYIGKQPYIDSSGSVDRSAYYHTENGYILITSSGALIDDYVTYYKEKMYDYYIRTTTLGYIRLNDNQSISQHYVKYGNIL